MKLLLALSLVLLVAGCASAPQIHPAEAAHWLARVSKALHATQIAEDAFLQAAECYEGCLQRAEYEERWEAIWNEINRAREVIADANRGAQILCGLQAANPNLDIPEVPGLCEPYRQPAEQGR